MGSSNILFTFAPINILHVTLPRNYLSLSPFIFYIISDSCPNDEMFCAVEPGFRERNSWEEKVLHRSILILFFVAEDFSREGKVITDISLSPWANSGISVFLASCTRSIKSIEFIPLLFSRTKEEIEAF